MKKLNKKKLEGIILHCTATKADQSVTVKSIRSWHKARGWDDIGYHFVIGTKGELWAGRSMDYQGAHTKGHNNAIGVAYCGGVDKYGQPEDTMTEKQEATFLRLVDTLRGIFGADTKVMGHNEFSSKACPSFDVVEKWGAEFCKHDVDLGPELPLDEIVDDE